MPAEKELVTSLLIEVGLELKRNQDEIKALVTKLVDEEWFDSIEALKSITDEEWTALKLPKRYFLKLKEKLDALSHDQETVVVPPLTEVSMEPPNPQLPWTKILLADVISAFKRSTEYSKEEKLEGLECLYRLVNAVLVKPDDASKRKIRKLNPIFHRKVGSKPLCLMVLEGAGFVTETENGEEYLELPIAYLSRLTDCSKLLAQTVASLGGTVPEMATTRVFNPYRTNLHTTRTNSDHLPNEHEISPDLDPAHINAQIAQERRLRATGGNPKGVVIPLNKIIYPSIRAVPRPKTVALTPHEYEDSSSYLSQADMIRIKETLIGNRQFKSSARERLEQLRKVPLYSQTNLLVIGTDESVLSLNFRPDTKIREVYSIIWNQGLSRVFRSLLGTIDNMYLIEPPARRLESDKTLFQLNLVPNATLRLKTTLDLPPGPAIQNFE